MRMLSIEPLTRQAFAPFGDVIETEGREFFMINDGSTRRFHRLAAVDAGADGEAIISIFRARALPMPLRITMLERHPRGSQAFVPLLGNRFLVVVAPPGDDPQPDQVRAFVTDGRQGVNYHRAVWHHPVVALKPEDEFLVVDRNGPGSNCDEVHFAAEQQLVVDASEFLIEDPAVKEE
jgi:ureidoglycolate lyase